MNKVLLLKYLSDYKIENDVLFLLFILAYKEVKKLDTIQDKYINEILSTCNDLTPIDLDSLRLFIAEYMESEKNIFSYQTLDRDSFRRFGLNDRILKAMLDSLKVPYDISNKIHNFLVQYITQKVS